MAAWDAEDEPLSVNGGFVLTPSRAWCTGVDAANEQMRKACRKAWNEDDRDLAIATQARLLAHLGEPWATIARQMTGSPLPPAPP